MNFFPSTSRVTSHSCWASRSCFNPKTKQKEEGETRGGREQKEGWVRIRQSRIERGWDDRWNLMSSFQIPNTILSSLVMYLSHHVWCSLPVVWYCHQGSPPPLSRCPTEVLLLPRPHPATAGDARWLCPPAQHSSEVQYANTHSLARELFTENVLTYMHARPICNRQSYVDRGL